MIKPLLRSLLLIGLCSTLATADWPERYGLRSADGKRAELRLAAESESRYAFDLTIAPQGTVPQRRWAGSLKVAGDRLVGSLGERLGAADRVVRRYGRDRSWKIEVSRGLAPRVVLRQGARRIELSSEAQLGARHAGNEAVIRRFYEAFSQRDAATMAAQYAPQIHFRDRVFPNLRGEQVGAMWAMLCESEDLVVTFSGVRADERYGVARWEARYSVFGNEVHNVIDASFELVDGKIVTHVDDFDFTRWVGQALPGPSKVLGPTPVLRTIRVFLKARLHTYLRKHRKKLQEAKK